MMVRLTAAQRICTWLLGLVPGVLMIAVGLYLSNGFCALLAALFSPWVAGVVYGLLVSGSGCFALSSVLVRLLREVAPNEVQP